LRGSAFDVFGYTEERRTERALIGEYMQHIEKVMSNLSHDNHAHALAIARVPENIKGFGHVKERNLKAARALWDSQSVI
jgi:indolepyruvate ferredoxin oxidoreductase